MQQQSGLPDPLKSYPTQNAKDQNKISWWQNKQQRKEEKSWSFCLCVAARVIVFTEIQNKKGCRGWNEGALVSGLQSGKNSGDGKPPGYVAQMEVNVVNLMII